MKCEKCENNAIFHYQCNINGEVSENHLCSACARAAGFSETLGLSPFYALRNLASPGGFMSGFFRGPTSGFVGGFFSEAPSKAIDGFFSTHTAGGSCSCSNDAHASCKSTKPEAQFTHNIHVIFPGSRAAGRETDMIMYDDCTAINIPEDAGEEIRAKRELHSLKNQLEDAIKAENFEKAAELRDKIRGLEQ